MSFNLTAAQNEKSEIHINFSMEPLITSNLKGAIRDIGNIGRACGYQQGQ